MTFDVREIRPDEYDVLGAITVAAYLTVGEDGQDGYLDVVRDVRRRAASCPVLVAVDDGRILGGVTYVPGPGTPYSESEREGEAGFRMLAVDPAGGQGRGAGRALVQACIDRARDERRSRIVLLTRPRMTAAHRLYLEMGFRRAPERDWEPEPGLELLGFELDLQSKLDLEPEPRRDPSSTAIAAD
jgi:ribosomal protein S18 acetylase RimI-like enzyme